MTKLAKARPVLRRNFGGLLDETMVRIYLKYEGPIEKTWRDFVISCSLRDQDIEEFVAAFDKGEKVTVRGYTAEKVSP